MPRYATSYFSFFDNEMVMNIVTADSDLDAAKAAFGGDGDFGGFDGSTLEDFQSFASDCDCMVGAIEIPD